jgi:hypothetical protein
VPRKQELRGGLKGEHRLKVGRREIGQRARRPAIGPDRSEQQARIDAAVDREPARADRLDERPFRAGIAVQARH